MAGLFEFAISIVVYLLTALLFYVISLKISPRKREDELYACGETHPEITITFGDLLKAVYRTLKRGFKK
jgi:hypothetical protein